MKLRVEPRLPGDLPVGALFFALLLFIPLGGHFVGTGQFEFAECGIKRAWGIPCLSCGATRATLLLLHGDLVGAFLMQPLIVSIYFLTAIWGITSLWAAKNNRTYSPDISWKEGVVVAAVCGAVVAANWFYLLKAGI